MKFLRGIRRVMGKPYAGDVWEDIYRVSTTRAPTRCPPPAPEKFSKSFQAYLDTRLTLEDLMKAADEEKKPKAKPS
jgi:hypothetical protein